MNRMLGMMTVICVTVAAFANACSSMQPRDWGHFDLLQHPRPLPLGTLEGQKLTPADYKQFVRWGEAWFRGETLGDERTITDVAGLMQATLSVPCAAPSEPGCTRQESVLPYFARAIDKLDGVAGNLFVGNGGPDGSGYTSNLVIEFPAGTRLSGIEVPEQLYTGLDVEAGSAWPIGIIPVPAPLADAQLPYLIDPASLGVGPVQTPGKLRIGISCALCHYSLDVDWDGQPDLHSAWPDRPTPGSPYRPEDAWAIGNQDLHVGWLFGLTANPMLGFSVLSGPIGEHDLAASKRWVEWVRDNYERSPLAVKKEVVRGMLTQPRGYADISPNALYDNIQFPLLFTRHGWPYNYDGSLINAGDRNSSVWTTALDFTGLIGLAKDRSAAGEALLYWETLNIYDALSAERFADMMVFDSPAVHHDPAQRKLLRDDILGLSDGVPGLMRPDCVSVVDGAPPGMLPPQVLAKARSAGRARTPADFGGDAKIRGAVVALVGTRVRTPPEVAAAIDLPAIARRYPGLHQEEFMNEAVSLMLDSLDPPRSHSALIQNSSSLWRQGYEVFKQSGCVTCHRGPFLTDNLIHRISLDRRGELGLARAPSTAGWRNIERGRGPAIETQPDRMLNSRVLQVYAAPDYDPRTGLATVAGSPAVGLFGSKNSGYKTTPLRYLWGSAPYLHDGGVAIALRPGTPPAGDDLRALLQRPATDKVYTMGAVLAERDRNPQAHLWPNPALSLQALLLQRERALVIAANRQQVIAVPRSDVQFDPSGEPPAERISIASLGAAGVGHEFWIDDAAGGEKITALIAFLLALDHFPAASAAARRP